MGCGRRYVCSLRFEPSGDGARDQSLVALLGRDDATGTLGINPVGSRGFEATGPLGPVYALGS